MMDFRLSVATLFLHTYVKLYLGIICSSFSLTQPPTHITGKPHQQQSQPNLRGLICLSPGRQRPTATGVRPAGALWGEFQPNVADARRAGRAPAG